MTVQLSDSFFNSESSDQIIDKASSPVEVFQDASDISFDNSFAYRNEATIDGITGPLIPAGRDGIWVTGGSVTPTNASIGQSFVVRYTVKAYLTDGTTVSSPAGHAQCKQYTVIGGNPEIQIDKVALDGSDKQEVEIGGTAQFQITIRNTGASDLENIVVSDPKAPDCENVPTTSLPLG